jgi:hypothetical protein
MYQPDDGYIFYAWEYRGHATGKLPNVRVRLASSSYDAPILHDDLLPRLQDEISLKSRGRELSITSREGCCFAAAAIVIQDLNPVIGQMPTCQADPILTRNASSWRVGTTRSAFDLRVPNLYCNGNR